MLHANHDFLARASIAKALSPDRETGEALPYVSIGVPHRDIGTVAQGDGTFRIVLPDDMQNDSLRFSMVGYQTLSFRIGDLAAKFPSGDPLRSECFKKCAGTDRSGDQAA
ncbi:MAG: carboxypeptidase-like regulatory domain-containing protein [Chitinophagales bacterium]